MKLDMMEQYEEEIVNKVITTDITYYDAAVSIILYFRDFVRPIDEIPTLLMRMIPSIKESEIKNALIWLERKGLIKYDNHTHYKMISIVDEFPEELERLSKVKGLASYLREAKDRRVEKVIVKELGKVGSGNNYDTFINILNSAQESIKYPILSTSPYPSLTQTLKRMAEKGVKIYLLIGDNDIVKKIKGNTQRSHADEWYKEFEGIPNIKIKMFSDIESVDLCTSVLIDEKTLRLVIYDPITVTSLDGCLLEIRNQSGQKINIIKWYNNKFDTAWNLAVKNKFWSIVRNIFSLLNLMVLVTITSIVYLKYYFNVHPLLQELVLIVLGSSGSYVVINIYKMFKHKINKLKKAIKSVE